MRNRILPALVYIMVSNGLLCYKLGIVWLLMLLSIIMCLCGKYHILALCFNIMQCQSIYWLAWVALVYTVSSPKYAPFFAAKMGRGCLLKYSISIMHTPPRFLVMLHSRSMIITAFWKNSQQLRWMCIMGNQQFDTKLRCIEATCSVSGDGTTLCKLVLQAMKTLVVTSEWSFSAFECMCIQMGHTRQRSQTKSSLKACPEDRCLYEGKY